VVAYVRAMAVFISVTTDPFAERRREAQERGAGQVVRRPLRGVQVKRDTYSVLRVLTATGREIDLLDGGSNHRDPDGTGYTTTYSNFLIQQIQENRMEKQQIVETFGEDYIFFFGERPRFLQVQGILLNTKSFDWKNEFWHNYEKYLRGTKLVENNARLYLYFDDVVVEGYLVAANTTQGADNPHMLPFNFQMFVTNYAITSHVGSVYFQQDAKASSEGLPAPSANTLRENATRAAVRGAAGGLHSFLVATSQAATNASFSLQSTIENVGATLAGGLNPALGASYFLRRTVDNRARARPPQINQPIYDMVDEYLGREQGETFTFDEGERRRVETELTVRRAAEVAAGIRRQLWNKGVDATRQAVEVLTHGEAEFAGSKEYGSFGIRQADGTLETE